MYGSIDTIIPHQLLFKIVTITFLPGSFYENYFKVSDQLFRIRLLNGKLSNSMERNIRQSAYCTGQWRKGDRRRLVQLPVRGLRFESLMV